MRKNYICLTILFFVMMTIHNSYVKAEENKQFKEWCIETFEYGEYIYEAYKNITFGIDYTYEGNKDVWQTPTETYKSKKGDCEDTAILFMDYLSLNQNNTEIVWGYIVKNGDTVARRHVWCEIIGRDGEKYFVEGCTRGWRGIIPSKESVYRYPILKISSHEFNRLSNSFVSPIVEEWKIKVVTYYGGTPLHEIQIIDGGYITYGHKGIQTNEIIFRRSQNTPPKFLMIDVKKEVSYLFVKLHELFTKCRNGG